MTSTPFRLRRARPDDVELFWQWVNEPGVRASAFRSAAIPIADHRKWFATRLEDPDCRIWVAIDERETPVGQIRFDIDDQVARVDVSVDARARGRGLGAQLIAAATRLLLEETDIRTVHAEIKRDNIASQQAFADAGYRSEGTIFVHGQEAVLFRYDR